MNSKQELSKKFRKFFRKKNGNFTSIIVFAKKEKIKFGEGVTVIVGPNGCGKTNIVDAIRWVLGEQKYSVLRSGKMGDVIFNGAEGLKPLSVCEAYLTVHNNRGKLPIEYTDLSLIHI